MFIVNCLIFGSSHFAFLQFTDPVNAPTWPFISSQKRSLATSRSGCMETVLRAGTILMLMIRYRESLEPPNTTKPILRYLTSATITCLLYTSDAADERSSVDLGGRRI